MSVTLALVVEVVTGREDGGLGRCGAAEDVGGDNTGESCKYLLLWNL